MTKRSLFVLGLLSFCLMLAVASPALATTRHTRITGLSSSRTTNTYKDTGHVTYSKSGHDPDVSRAYIKVYRYIGGHWVYHTHIHAGTTGYFKVSEPSGYLYKFKYIGSKGHYYSSYMNTRVVKPANSELFAFLYTDADDDVFTVGSSETTAATGGAVAYYDLSDEDPAGWLIGVPVKIAKLQADQTYSEYVTVETDADGYWTADLPIGEYRISIDAHPAFATVDGITYDLVADEWSLSVVAEAPVL